MANTVRNAPIAWAQRDNLVLLTIELDDVKVEELSITPTAFKFRGSTKECAYETSFDFYGDVKEDDIKKGANTRHIELAIGKKKSEWWPRLLKEKVKVHWLKVDFGKWKEEDDSDAEGAGDNLNFNNFDLSQYTSQMGGEAPDLGDLGDEDDEDDDEIPELEDAEDEGGEKKENGGEKH